MWCHLRSSFTMSPSRPSPLKTLYRILLPLHDDYPLCRAGRGGGVGFGGVERNVHSNGVPTLRPEEDALGARAHTCDVMGGASENASVEEDN